ncbi:hypothetical protein COCON_G00173790 [Conger conger]|uniref:Uncharacterized protein n=1 Tax=Conger conger TaxID=82655 RepID=A0A9Q1D4X0_CONCO|nr:hypothetical protein COCON_G00173790 [Conger conger]
MMGCCLFVNHRKKRKQRRREADALSLCSLDINVSKRGPLPLTTRYTLPPSWRATPTVTGRFSCALTLLTHRGSGCVTRPLVILYRPLGQRHRCAPTH